MIKKVVGLRDVVYIRVVVSGKKRDRVLKTK